MGPDVSGDLAYQFTALSKRDDGFQWLAASNSSSCTTPAIVTYRSRDSAFEVQLRTVSAKMTVTGDVMNRNGFQTCCNRLRLATALLYLVERLWKSLPFFFWGAKFSLQVFWLNRFVLDLFTVCIFRSLFSLSLTSL